MTATGFKVPRRPTPTVARLIRISGEVVTSDEAAKRVGCTPKKLLERFREGRKTWEALASKQR